MNRRGFLGWALGTATAVAVLPSIEALAIEGTPEAEAAAWLSTFQKIHLEAYQLFQGFMATQSLPVVDEFVFDANCMGATFPDGTRCAHQFNIMLDTSILERSIEPAMRALAYHASAYGLDRYGSLVVPCGVDYAANVGPLRMIRQYQILTEENLVRFDVLGGASPDGLRTISRRRQAELKARLQAKWRPRLVK